MVLLHKAAGLFRWWGGDEWVRNQVREKRTLFINFPSIEKPKERGASSRFMCRHQHTLPLKISCGWIDTWVAWFEERFRRAEDERAAQFTAERRCNRFNRQTDDSWCVWFRRVPSEEKLRSKVGKLHPLPERWVWEKNQVVAIDLMERWKIGN